ncbi:MAG: ATP-binding protein [Bacteroidales bacterium]|nr:ATP-binding protein [Bacteroidales bacterium]
MTNKVQETNPFSVIAYLGSDYFCDRENETKRLFDGLKNGRNITLISPRRMGKTGLIKHVFEEFDPKEALCFYVDLDRTTCLADLVQTFGKVVLKQIGMPSRRVWKEILSWFKSLRPVLSAEPATGAPQISLDIKPTEAEASLDEIFGWLEKSKLPCYVAFDEFQVITEYPEPKMEALMLSHIQHLTNVNFVFAGSQKHLMTEMFMAANRPFFQSTQMLPLYEIPEDTYFDFAQRHLERNKQTLSRETFHELYATVYGHTWYIQCILNRLYQYGTRQIDRQALALTMNDILEEYKETFRTYCKLLTSNQLSLLKAIAKEGKVKEIGSQEFLQKHQPGPASTIRSALRVLIGKELIMEDKNGYSVYDRFFGLWLRR